MSGRDTREGEGVSGRDTREGVSGRDTRKGEG